MYAVLALESWKPPKYKCEAPIIGVWGKAPSGIQSRASDQGDRGRPCPPEAP